MSMTAVGKNIHLIDLGPFGRAVFGQIEYAPGGVFGPRIQRDLQLVIVDAGSVTVTTDGVARRLGPGQIACQWPGGHEQYVFDRRCPSRHRWVALTPAADPGPEHWAAMRRRWPGVAVETPAMSELFRLAIAGVSADDPAGNAIRVGLGVAYAAGFKAAPEMRGSLGGTRSALPAPLVAMRRVIASRYDQPLTLDDLAAAASVTPHHLIRLCRKELDTTPMRLLWNTRLDRGLELIRHTGLSVSEVAYRVGFRSPFHFSRLFKERIGRSPKGYRQSYWNR